jgi:hypothetical protein
MGNEGGIHAKTQPSNNKGQAGAKFAKKKEIFARLAGFAVRSLKFRRDFGNPTHGLFRRFSMGYARHS